MAAAAMAADVTHRSRSAPPHRSAPGSDEREHARRRDPSRRPWWAVMALLVSLTRCTHAFTLPDGTALHRPVLKPPTPTLGAELDEGTDAAAAAAVAAAAAASAVSAVAGSSSDEGVPPSLSRVVQLASSITTGAASHVLQMDGRPATAGQFHSAERFDALQLQQQSAAPWAVRDQTTRHHGHQPVVQELNDSFDPVVPSLWEHVSGGGVGDECGSVAGKALCFNQVGARFAVTAPVNTIAGGEVRFSLRILPDEAVQATVAFEYKAIGKGWVALQNYTEADYDQPAYANPNGASLALWAGGGVNGFVMYTVELPDAAKSAITKFRWRQVLEAMQVSSNSVVGAGVVPWALDDLAIDVEADAPAVQLSSSHVAGRTASLLTVVAQFTQPVVGFDAADVVVANATVTGLTHFKTKVMGVGDLYTLMLRPDGVDGQVLNVSVQVPAGGCRNHKNQLNLASNTLLLQWGGGEQGRARKSPRMEQAFGAVRLGPADAAEAAAVTDLGVRPLREGEAHPYKDQVDSQLAAVFVDSGSVGKKLSESEAIYRRLAKQANPPAPAMLLAKLKAEIATLQHASSSLTAAEALALHRTNHPSLSAPAHAHEAEHAELHEDMDKLREEREQTYSMMQEARKMRDALLAEQEAVRAEREAARAEAEADAVRQHEEHERQVTDFAAVVREAMREEVSKFHEMELEAHGDGHDGHGGHSHDGHGHGHHEDGHAHGGTAGQSIWVEGDDKGWRGQSAVRGWHDQHDHGYSPSGLVVDEVHEELHLQIDSLEQERKVIESELSAQRDDLTSMTQAAQELKREREEMAAERASFLQAEARERDQWASDQMKLMEVMSAQHKALHEQTLMLREERDALGQVYDAEHHGHDHHNHHPHDGQLEHRHTEEHHHGHHEHDSHDHELMEAERVRLEAERAGLEAARREERSMLEELQAVRAQIIEEKERMAREAKEELAAEKERMAEMQRVEAEQRMAWASEQRKFMEELMAQQRALREQAQWISQEHQSHWGAGAAQHALSHHDAGAGVGHSGAQQWTGAGVGSESQDPGHTHSSDASIATTAPGQSPVTGAHAVRADQSPFHPS